MMDSSEVREIAKDIVIAGVVAIFATGIIIGILITVIANSPK